MATVHSDQQHLENDVQKEITADLGECSDITFEEAFDSKVEVTTPKTKRSIRTDHIAVKKRILKRFTRPEPNDTLSMEELGEKILQLGASLQKRKPELASSEESGEDCSPTQPIIKRKTSSSINKAQRKVKKNCKGFLEPVVFSLAKNQTNVFPCFMDSSIYACDSKLKFENKLRKHGFDNDADTSSEELENAKRNTICHLNTFISNHTPHLKRKGKKVSRSNSTKTLKGHPKASETTAMSTCGGCTQKTTTEKLHGHLKKTNPKQT